MKSAVISDIHGNLTAFKAVLEDIDRLEIDRVLCLGDNIGYGPEPEEVVRLLRSRGIPSVMGNHELAVVDEKSLKRFNPTAKQALLQTKSLLSGETLDFIRALPSVFKEDACLFVHGSPPDSINTYLFELSEENLKAKLQAMEEPLCMVGHTHDLEIVNYHDGKVSWKPLRPGKFQLNREWKYIINVGSVGQPRDPNNNAKYVVWDQEACILEVRYVAYDIQKTVEKILALGFPRIYADRLW
jgi:predicted phosphodiesterase